MKSIIQSKKIRCFVCGAYGNTADPLDCHHVFGGALRNKSEEYGLTVYLHHNQCHLNGVHKIARLNRIVQARVQEKAMKHYGWDMEQWRSLFYKNYMEDD